MSLSAAFVPFEAPAATPQRKGVATLVPGSRGIRSSNPTNQRPRKRAAAELHRRALGRSIECALLQKITVAGLTHMALQTDPRRQSHQAGGDN